MQIKKQISWGNLLFMPFIQFVCLDISRDRSISLYLNCQVFFYSCLPIQHVYAKYRSLLPVIASNFSSLTRCSLRTNSATLADDVETFNSSIDYANFA